MINVKELAKALKQVAEEKGLQPEKVLEAIESSIAAAYKREYGERGAIVKAKLDMKTGDLKFWQIKTVVDESTVRFVEEGEEGVLETTAAGVEKNARGGAKKSGERPEKVVIAAGQLAESDEMKLPRFNPERHITLEDAKKIKKGVTLDEELTFPLETKEDFGRIAAQTAKQVILQKLRESERDSILSEWRDKEGQIVSGVVQRFERGHVYVDLSRTIGVMFANESIPGEHYRAGERLRFLVLAVQEDARLPGIILSRSHPKFVMELFKMEVPELAEGVVEIKAIAREPGNRTKLAVISKSEGVDPVGALVGQRGTRVMAVNNELGQEKIDIIEYSDDPEKFISNSISPAKVRSVEILPRREARIYVPEDQLSLAIGKGGQNVRLAAKLTGWKIDVRSQTRPEEKQEGGVAGSVDSEDQIPEPQTDEEPHDIS
ncbi:MAG: transcription termination factor NusA [Candidatus Liptonbacteria bacterium]|nr:transcription termination factor NusA [Candidatus Liptonbacteria bacterium]